MNELQFYERIQRQVNLPTTEVAAEAAAETIRSLRMVLPRSVAADLGAQLPPRLALELEGGPEEADPLVDADLFVGRLMDTLETESDWDQTLGGLDLVSVNTGDEAIRRTCAVFSALQAVIDPRTSEAIANALPGAMREWYQSLRS